MVAIAKMLILYLGTDGWMLSGGARQNDEIERLYMHSVAGGRHRPSTNTHDSVSQGTRRRKCYRVRTVANEHIATSSRGKPTFIDLDAAFPDQTFAILVWDEDRQNVGALPRTGTHVCATGLISYYHGVPQIIVRSSEQLSR
jgi:hypothetical protein